MIQTYINMISAAGSSSPSRRSLCSDVGGAADGAALEGGKLMPENAILFSSFPAVSIIECLIVLTIAVLAYFVVFNNFEKHVPLPQRIRKLLIVVGCWL